MFVTYFLIMLLVREEYYIHKGDVFSGTVVELTEETITIRWWSGVPRTFSVSPVIASNDLPLEWKPGCGHRLGDVRVGDKAYIRLVPTARGPVVIAMGIYRRPGGKIPPAEDAHLPDKYRIHNRANAEQAVEEKVLPKLARKLLHFHP